MRYTAGQTAVHDLAWMPGRAGSGSRKARPMVCLTSLWYLWEVILRDSIALRHMFLGNRV